MHLLDSVSRLFPRPPLAYTIILALSFPGPNWLRHYSTATAVHELSLDQDKHFGATSTKFVEMVFGLHTRATLNMKHNKKLLTTNYDDETCTASTGGGHSSQHRRYGEWQRKENIQVGEGMDKDSCEGKGRMMLGRFGTRLISKRFKVSRA